MNKTTNEAAQMNSQTAVECKVYAHVKNGKQYHSAKRETPTSVYVRGDVSRGNDGHDYICLFAINAKTGLAWQAGRYFKTSDVKLVGTINI